MKHVIEINISLIFIFNTHVFSFYIYSCIQCFYAKSTMCITAFELVVRLFINLAIQIILYIKIDD